MLSGRIRKAGLGFSRDRISLENKPFENIKVPEEFQKYVQLDNYLSDLSDQNIGEAADFIEKSFSKHTMNYVFRSITFFSKIRPLQHDLLGELFSALAISHSSYKPPILRIVEINPIFARKLFTLGVYSVNEIQETFEHFSHERQKYISNNRFRIQINDDVAIPKGKHLMTSRFPKQIFGVFSDLLQPSFPVSFKYTTGYPKNSIWEVLKYDQIDKLKALLKEIPEDSGKRKFFEQETKIAFSDSLYGEEIGVIDFAAYYSAQNCFDYLIHEYERFLQISDQTLRFAFLGGNYNIIKSLLDKGLDISSSNILDVVKYHYYDLVHLVIKNRSNYNLACDDVIRTRSIKFFFYIKNIAPSLFNISFLRYAVSNDDDAMFDAILYRENKSTQIILDQDSKERILCYAIKNNNEYITKQLLQLDVNPNQTANNVSCLVHAARNRNYKIIQLLLDKGARVDSDENGNSPITKILKTGDYKIIKYFFERGAGRVDASQLKHSLIYYAVCSGNTDVIEYTLQNCPDSDINKDTDLRRRKSIQARAILFDDPKLLQFLLSKGMKLDCGDKLLQMTNNFYHQIEIIKILLNNNYKPKEEEINDVLENLIRSNNEKKINEIISIQNIIVEPSTLNFAISTEKVGIFPLLVSRIDTKVYNYTPCIINIINTKRFNLEHIKILVEKGVNLNDSVQDKNYTSVIRTSWGVAKVKSSSHQTTPLSAAIRSEKLPIIHYLIEKGANINGAAEVAAGKSLEMLKLLTENNPNFDPSDCNVYHAAINNNKLDVLDYLFSVGLSPNSKDNDGFTILAYAIRNKNCKCIEKIIEMGSDLNLPCNSKMKTPLQLAIRMREMEIVKLLVNSGADVNLTYNNNKIPVTLFIKQIRRQEDLSILLDKNPDLSIRSGHRRIETPLTQAISMKLDNIVLLLIEHGADINQKDENGDTPLFKVNSVSIAKILIDHGADINEQNNKGVTPLMRIASNQNDDLVRFFIDNGADVSLRDYGSTPADLAVSNEVREYLNSL